MPPSAVDTNDGGCRLGLSSRIATVFRVADGWSLVPSFLADRGCKLPASTRGHRGATSAVGSHRFILSIKSMDPLFGASILD
ncbi:hypothetical protein VTJ04DRAFT_7421 [Mycothermus thermophilus]|uniref:uncharacterized protein n=1 Tax=Humicola insolens TaxID=85995 RepID=UPI003742EB2B